MKEYTLFFRLNITDKDKQPSPEQMNTYMKDWMQWLDGISATDQLADGGSHFSYTTARVIRSSKVSDGPYTANSESLAGYILVRANNIEGATQLALKCPILQGDGCVEVREHASM